MNYFPFWPDFKNANQYNVPFSVQYDYQNPYLSMNPLHFYQIPQSTINWSNNNDFKQTFNHENKNQDLKLALNDFSQSLKPQEDAETHRDKNNQAKQKKDKMIFKQKEGRNMLSNLFRQVIKCILLEKERTLEIIQKISQIQNIQINARDFLENLSKKTKTLKNYVRIGQIQIFLKGKQNDKSKQNAKVLRILIHRFLRQDIIPCLCNNPKVQNSNRLIHILQRRKLQNLISL